MTSASQELSRRAMPRSDLLMLFLPLILLLAQIVVCGLINDRFFSFPNALNLMRQSAVLLLVASGLNFVILIGSIDLSIGAIVTLSAVVVALLVRDLGFGLWSLPAAALVGLTAGAVNAFFNLIGRVPSFLATL